MDDDLLMQRVASVFQLFPETLENDTALVFRVACMYGASHGMSAENSLVLPKTYRIRKVARLLKARMK